MNKDIKVKLIPLSKANRAVDKIVDISTGEQVPNKENTLIYVDKDNTPVNKDYLENNNYTYINDAGDFHSIKPLQEVIISPKPTVSDILQKFVNDEILLNKNNIRVNNMRKFLSTDSGRDIQKSFSEGGKNATLLIGSPIITSGIVSPILSNPTSTILGLGGSYIGEKVVNKISKNTTGNTWGQNISNIWNKYSPTVVKMPEWVGTMTNPGIILDGAYITFNTGGKFSFKENSLIKNAKEKRDMRKKLIKSDRPTYNIKFIKKAQQGSSINYVTYTKLAPEVVDYETMDIPELEEDNINDVFSPYSYLKSHIPIEEDIEEDIEDPIEDTKTTNWIPKSREDYINIMGKALRNALINNNINPEIWTNYLLAQTALESNWGKSSISTKYNNYGGIKGTGSGSVSTREYSPQRGYYSTHSSFKSFNSVEDFADYFVKTLRDKFKAFSTTPGEYLKNIRNHEYFTAPLNDYSRTFNSILNSISIKAQKGYKLNYVTYTPIPIKDISYPDILDIPEPNKPTVSNDLEYSDTSSENYLEDDTEEYDISKSIEDLFKDAGIDIEITSSYRPGATTKSGRTSWHSVKDKYGNSRAYDIKPINGDFQALKNAMINNPLIRYYFSKRGLGVLDETTPDMMARTGATGKHFHIGPDKLAIQTWNEWIS